MSLEVPDKVHIAAGGYGNRIRETMVDLGFSPDLPKHLLPLGENGEGTLLGRIVQQALDAPTAERPVVYANRDNFNIFRKHPEIGPFADVVVGNFDNSLGPFIRNVVGSQRRTLGCAGDFYADFQWETVLDAHESHGFPVTFMAGQTVAVDGGAVFDVGDNHRIERLRRANRTDASELINVGVYVFDSTKEVLGILEELARNASMQNVRLKEDLIVHALIKNGLAGAYVLPTQPYNVNTAETYRALIDHLKPAPSTSPQIRAS